MCGIAGSTWRVVQEHESRVLASIAHRGPDGSGVVTVGDLALFHTRLVILDQDGGRQPFTDQSGRYTLVYNGEIYNHLEIRRELSAAQPGAFRTDHSDTETLFQYLIAHKGAGLDRLNGMFSFAFYDRDENVLLLARDYYGEKPLYVYLDGKNLAFASELSVLSGLVPQPLTPSPEGIKQYLICGFSPGTTTIFQNVFKVQPGSLLRIKLTNLQTSKKSFRAAEDRQTSVSSSRSEFQLRLLQAVTQTLQSDTQVGLFLSGGLDSSSIAWALSELGRSVDTPAFSVSFDNSSFDEYAWAQRVAETFHLPHFRLRLGTTELVSLAQDVLASTTEPLADPSLVATLGLCRFAGQHVKVALSGDGGDELFAGYDPFRAVRIAAALRDLGVSGLIARIGSALEMLEVSGKNLSPLFKALQFSRGVDADTALVPYLWMSNLTLSHLDKLLPMERVIRDEFFSTRANEIPKMTTTSVQLIRAIEGYFLNEYLPNGVLAKSDRASMSASVESRAVFLERDFSSWARQLDISCKLKGSRTKILMRASMEPVLPSGLAKRKKKGFGIPLSDVIGELKPEFPILLTSVIDEGELRKIWPTSQGFKRNHARLIWSLLVLKASLEATRRSGSR